MNGTTYWGLVIAAAVLSVIVACNPPHETTSNSGPDKQSLPTGNANANANSASDMRADANTDGSQDKFLSEAAAGGMAEVELGRLAQTKAQNAEVKQFAEMMITDHGRASVELKSLATRKNISLPTSVGGKHIATIQRLQNLAGSEFDRAYVDAMVEDHESDVRLFEMQARGAPDSDVKGFAEKTLPTLQRHLERIRAIQTKIKGGL